MNEVALESNTVGRVPVAEEGCSSAAAMVADADGLLPNLADCSRELMESEAPSFPC
jgi:hypothetical protein